MPAQPNESVGGFSSPGASAGGNAAALQYQHFTVDTNAHGFIGGTLGRGNRSVPSPSSFFSSESATPSVASTGRNLSAGQFGSGGAKDTMVDEEEND